MRSLTAAVAAALLLTAASTPAARAADGDTGRLVLATDRVVVFKDGHALFVKTATGTADAAGRVFTEQVPGSVILGCFWATAGERAIVSMRAEWKETRSERVTEHACHTVRDLLRANRGRRVTLELQRPEDDRLTGVLVDVLETEGEAAEADAFLAGRGPDFEGTVVQPLPVAGGELAVIDLGDAGRRVLPVAQIRTVTGTGLLTTTSTVELVYERRKRLTMDLGAEAAGREVDLRILYFAEGLRWIPTYRVSGDLESTAGIALQGELLNEAEDLVDTQLDLVVGVPHFRFKDLASPLTLERTLRGALARAAPQLMGQMMSNSFQARSGERWDAAPAPGEVVMPGTQSGEGSGDLFVYSVGRIDLAKGQRATHPLWQSTANLRHLYTADVDVVRDPRSAAYSYRSAKQGDPATPAGPNRTTPGLVWHELELANESDVPWTTGAALLLRGTVPLGQDLLGYTPPGAKALLPVTVAVDIRGAYAEEEIERRSNALNWSSTTYSLVRKKGAVTLTNHRAAKATVRIAVSLGGRAETASDEGRIVVNDLRSADWGGNGYAVNNHSDVTWELELAAGESRTLETVFSFYVR